MVAALQDQKVYRRNGKGISKRVRSNQAKTGFRTKNRFLTFLFSITIVLLLSSSVVFSMAMLKTNQKPVAAENAILDDTELNVLFNEENFPEIAPALINGKSVSGNEAAIPDPGTGSPAGYNTPLVHIVKQGNTIYEISKQYNVSLYEIIFYNKIHDPAKLQINDKIYIPQAPVSISGAAQNVNLQETGSLPGAVEIEADVLSGNPPLAVKFRLKTALSSRSLIYIWDFGNDKFAFSPDASTTYTKIGDYRVFLMISDQENNEIISNKLMIKVNSPPSVETRIKKAKAADYYYLTANQLNDVMDFRSYFAPDSTQTVFDLADTKIEQSSPLIKQIDADKFLTVNSGYAVIRVSNGSHSFTANLFVSPYPSRHAFEPEFDWYKTQYKTGYGNCGPACVAMAIHWAKAEPVSVERIRNEIGFPVKSGAISLDHMFGSFKNHSVNSFYTIINSKEDLFRIVDRGNIAIFAYHTGKISHTTGDKTTNYVGRYYPDTTGHYSIVKGYTLDKKYFITYDPIPGDWGENVVRYGDGESMIGRNRYYLVDELMSALRKTQVVEVSRG